MLSTLLSKTVLAALLTIHAARAAAVPSRAGLKVRADPTASSSASSTEPSVLTGTVQPLASPTAKPTEGRTVTATLDTNGVKVTYRPKYGQDYDIASELGWIQLSVVATNQTSCPFGGEPALPTYTEITSTMVVDNRHFMGCCFGAYAGDIDGYRYGSNENFTSILSGTRDAACFAINRDQTSSLPYGVAQSYIDSLTSPAPYPIATATLSATVNGAPLGRDVTSALALGRGLGLFTVFGIAVGAAVLVL